MVKKNRGMNTKVQKFLGSKVDIDLLNEEGGYGKIYKVRAEDKKYVLKSVDIEKCRDEFDIMKECQSEFVLDLFYDWKTKDKCYGLMKYCENDNLVSHIEKEGYYSPKDAKPVLHYIMRGLEFIHLKKIIHGDIKTENVFMTSSEVKIGDFGHAVRASNEPYGETEDVMKISTGCCMAPERLTHDKITYMLDTWAFGVLAFDIVSDISIFDEETFEMDMNKVRTHQQKKLIKIGNRKLKSIICDCLEVNPYDRPNESDILARLKLI